MAPYSGRLTLTNPVKAAEPSTSFGSRLYTTPTQGLLDQVQGVKIPSLTNVLDRVRKALEVGLNAFETGLLGLNAFRKRAQEVIRRGAVAAVATITRLTENVRDMLQGYLTKVFEELDGWLADIATRAITGRDRQTFLEYGTSINTIVQSARLQSSLDDNNGNRESLEMRRVLSGAKHCPSCEAYAAQGWTCWGCLPDIGEQCECRNRCLCRIEVRQVSQDGNLQQRTDQSEEAG